MRVAVSMRVVSSPVGREIRDALSHDWMRWLSERGYRIFPIPNLLDDPAGYLLDLKVEGLILTGGNDVIPCPGAEDTTSPIRTKTEQNLLATAAKNNIPVLAVCRGLHVVNAFFGGALVDDLRAQTNGAVAHVAHNHPVRLSGCFAGLAAAEFIETNSFHKQGVRLRDLAPALSAFAMSPADDVVEGAVHRTFPLLAVQWHPERPNPASSFDRLLVSRLFTEGQFWR